MLLKMRTIYAGPRGTADARQVADFDEDEAKILKEAKAAVEYNTRIEAENTRAKQKVERAQAKPEVKDMKRRRRAKKPA